MNKIATGVLGLALTASLTGGAAYAQFTTTAQVQGLSIDSGSASLQVSIGAGTPSSTLDLSSGGGHLGNVFPGQSVDLTTGTNPLVLTNSSTGGFALTTHAQITDSWVNTHGNFAALEDNVNLNIQQVDNSGVAIGSPVSASLHVAHDAGIDLPGQIAALGHQNYAVTLTVNSNADNTISNTDLTNITVLFTGTQVETP